MSPRLVAGALATRGKPRLIASFPMGVIGRSSQRQADGHTLPEFKPQGKNRTAARSALTERSFTARFSPSPSPAIGDSGPHSRGLARPSGNEPLERRALGIGNLLYAG